MLSAHLLSNGWGPAFHLFGLSTLLPAVFNGNADALAKMPQEISRYSPHLADARPADAPHSPAASFARLQAALNERGEGLVVGWEDKGGRVLEVVLVPVGFRYSTGGGRDGGES